MWTPDAVDHLIMSAVIGGILLLVVWGWCK